MGGGGADFLESATDAVVGVVVKLVVLGSFDAAADGWVSREVDGAGDWS